MLLFHISDWHTVTTNQLNDDRDVMNPGIIQCAANVQDMPKRWDIRHRCKHKAAVGSNYCKQHDPFKVTKIMSAILQDGRA